VNRRELLFSAVTINSVLSQVVRAQENPAGNSTKSANSASFITAEQAKIYPMLGRGEARLLVTGEQSEQAFWLGDFREFPGFLTQLHRHPHTDEQFYVLEGVLSMYYDGKWHDFTPGMLGLVPRGVVHAQGNHSKENVRFIGSGNPAGFEKLFPAVEDLLKRGMKPGDPQFVSEMAKIWPKCDTEPLGPAPPRT
jgi:mannose-6-phosphate isomerase-like protein (cupin superfamily)